MEKNIRFVISEKNLFLVKENGVQTLRLFPIINSKNSVFKGVKNVVAMIMKSSQSNEVKK